MYVLNVYLIIRSQFSITTDKTSEYILEVISFLGVFVVLHCSSSIKQKTWMLVNEDYNFLAITM